jgi:hypothetical protein
MCINVWPLRDDGFVITSDQAIHVAGFTLLSRGIQAYWHEKSPTEENSEILVERFGVHSKKERRHFHTVSSCKL